YEVADAIARSDMDDLKDELGDLLLQVVFHSRMAEEDGLFAFDDVANAISEKMIRRHPHVFGDLDAADAGAVKIRWEDIKAAEKAERARRRQDSGATEPGGLLADIPVALPALMRAGKIQKRAARVGFDWTDLAPVLAKIAEELDEVRAEMAAQAPDQTKISDEVGDVLFAVANLARHLKIDPEDALHRANRKFIRRFGQMEDAALAGDTDLDALSLDELEALWAAAKAGE
ncbi:MAG: nucleoside triphosphate pyrophosphohydrolase, partial [Alphaproteobacteria bacterium]